MRAFVFSQQKIVSFCN